MNKKNDSIFRIYDKVRVIANNGDAFDEIEIGDIGMVIDINPKLEYPISLKIGKHLAYPFKEEELELVDVPVSREEWSRKRRNDLLDAIMDFSTRGINVPTEWFKELQDLLNE